MLQLDAVHSGVDVFVSILPCRKTDVLSMTIQSCTISSYSDRKLKNIYFQQHTYIDYDGTYALDYTPYEGLNSANQKFVIVILI